MNIGKRTLTAVLCLLAVLLCAIGLTACSLDCAHEWNEWQITKEATCTSTGTAERFCEICGTIETKTVDMISHEWNEWQTTKEATCTSTGTAERSCKNCETIDHKSVEMTPHDFEDATCTEPKTCRVCKATEGAPLGHDWNAWVSNGDGTHTGTCTRDASHTETDDCSGGTATCTNPAVCEHCGAAYGTPLPHSFDQQNTDAAYLKTPAGCETKAVYYYSCTCGEKGTETFEWGEPLGHSWSAWVSNGDGTHTKTCAHDANHTETDNCSGGTATCTNPAVCEHCGGAWGDALGHKWGEWVPNGDGTHTRACANDANHTETENCSGGTATCTDRAVCDHCGAAYGEEPTHTWDEGVVTTEATCTTDGVRTYTCSVCHETRTEKIDATGHDYAEAVTSPTCTEKGYTTYTCRTCDHTYTGNEIGATGHNWDGEVTCETGRECTVCHITEPATNHNYVSVGTTEPDCEHPGTETFRCENCGTEYATQTAPATGHSISGVTPTERQLSGCEYIQIYVCTACGGEVEGDHVFHHTYVASVTREATCVADGEKTLVCSACGDTKTETIAKNENGHSWDEGTLEGNIRTYHCQNDGCTATKTSVDASGSTSANVSAGDLANAGGVQLENAEIAMDEDTLAQMSGKDLTISSDTLTGEDLDAALSKLDDAQKAQLGNDPKIYNFLIMEGGTALSQFDGEVTVTLPYTLSEGEDVDSIAVWYMSEGAPVSIKATYSNGYITFKTTHFSYYTVTLLTPQERCALYGHNYATSHVEGTCLTDGYDLKVCRRCYETVKTVTQPATGHHYVGETTDPTCVSAGKTVYTCEHCHGTYEVKLPAIGHAWEESEHVDATCAAPGYVLYACANCGETYRVTSAQLMHTYTDTVVPPTCDAQGYTHHVCDSCGYAYDDTPVPSLGHKYNLTFEWSDDHLTATAVFVCENDRAHTLSVAATVTVKVTEPTCAEAGHTVYTAKATLNGVTYTDTQAAAGEKLDHSYSDEWTYGKDEHWHACTVCGDRTGVAAHAFDEGTVTKQPTCSEAGETVFACACGFVKTEVVPATGEHDYVDGVCTMCGKADGACDHTHLHEEVIDMADYGACGGLLHVQVCDCGERVMLDVENSEPMCDLSGAEQQGGIDENGNMWMSMSCVCPECGMVIRMHATAMQNGCTNTIFFDEITFISADGTAILDHAQAETISANHHYDKATIDLGKLGFCGGTVTVMRCPDCGEVGEIHGMNLACDMSTGTTEDQFTDENGIVHMVMEFVCADCGLYVKGEMWEEKPSVCVTVAHIFYSFYGPDSTIFECNQKNTQSNHAYEITDLVLHGETCEDGYTATETCRICGDSHRYQSSGHRTEEVVVDIAELGGCGGQMVYRACSFCHTITDMLESNIGCSMKQTGSTTITDEQGHQHTVYTYVCEACGLIYVTDMWMENTSPCVTVVHGTMSIRSGEELLWSGVLSRTQVNHNYERVYELLGETCDDGYRVTETCTACGESHTGIGGGHFHEETVIDLSAHSDCGSLIRVNRCAICGETSYFKMEIQCDGKTTQETYIDNEGIEHWVQTLTCDRCGLVWWAETWTVPGDGCEVTDHASVRVSKDGEIIFEGTSTNTWPNHNYEYTYHLHGETCEDGYTVTYTCTVCGETDTREESGHRSEKQQISLEEYGACGGWINREYCPVCDKTLYCNVYSHCPATVQTDTVDRDGITHTVETRFCEECGLVIVYDSYTVPETSCRYKRYITCTVTMGDTVLFSEEYVETGTQHSYEYEFFLKGETCEDGYTVTATCANCGEIETWEGHDHKSVLIATYDLADYGACYGHFEHWKCPCGAEEYVSYDFCGSWSYSSYEDGEGHLHDVSVCECETCGLRYQQDRFEMHGNDTCTTTVSTTYTLSVGETLVANVTILETREAHRYEVTASLPDGHTSCDDGVVLTYTCPDCGNSYEETTYTHDMLTVATIDLAQYGAVCGGYLTERACACGARHEMDTSGVLCERVSVDTEFWIEDALTDSLGNGGFYRYAYAWQCAVTDPEPCIAVRYAGYFRKAASGCYAEAYQTWQIGYDAQNGTCLYEVTFKTGEVIAFHNYEVTEINAAEDGYTVTGIQYTCPDCGSYRYEKNYHDETGRLCKAEYVTVNLLDNGREKYDETVFEYVYTTDNDGNPAQYISREYRKSIDANDNEFWSETLREMDYTFTAGFSDYGYRTSETTTLSNGSVHSHEFAQVRYMGNWYPIYEYNRDKNEEDDYWHRTEYTYDFAAGCVRYIHETDSNGMDHTQEDTCHQTHWVVVKDSTCTQDGLEEHVCDVCEQTIDQSVTTANDHDWMYDEEKNTYICTACGLENVNGVSGDIVLEDLTAKAGNGTDYVVGYYNRSEVEFIYYVCLILHTPAEDGNNEVFLEDIAITEPSGIRGFAFAKADVIAAAEELGYAAGEYDVRFAFVPAGADGRVDYAITFTD